MAYQHQASDSHWNRTTGSRTVCSAEMLKRLFLLRKLGEACAAGRGPLFALCIQLQYGLGSRLLRRVESKVVEPDAPANRSLISMDGLGVGKGGMMFCGFSGQYKACYDWLWLLLSQHRLSVEGGRQSVEWERE